MSEVVAALEAKGLVRRRSDPDHGRILRTELTERGAASLAAADGTVDEIEAQMLAELAPPERERLLAWLASCARMLGAGIESAS